MYCSRCGSPISEETTVCSHCGASLADDQQVQVDLRDLIVGHWVESGRHTDTHYYFDEHSLIVIDSQRPPVHLTYKVIDSDRDKGWLRIWLSPTSGRGHQKDLYLSREPKELTVTTNFGSGPMSPEPWIYWGPETRPDAS
jgi:zinc-ribbon domain